jgi:UDP-N-acetylglucosamine--N-acetylmuramyl-(pentapeptide) pyrophosphoryl-undecaprenol N-acetylglucosamine transferase
MPSLSPTIVITGGHLSPALATINLLEQQGWRVIFYGRQTTSDLAGGTSDEYQVITDRSLQFRNVVSGRLHRNSLTQACKSLIKVPFGLYQSLRYLRTDRPNVVLTFGGYLALPTIMAAWLLRIPIIIHEQTAAAGLANRIGATFATKVAISFNTSRVYFPVAKCILTGNPIRSQALQAIKQPTALIAFPHRRTIYITGGGQGSSTINRAVLALVDRLTTKYNLIHAIGPGELHDQEWQTAQDLLQKLPVKRAKAYFSVRYLGPNHIGSIFARADLVIARSGANTCTEIAHLNKPAILIPLPFVQKNEQHLNAQMLVDLGLATVIPQDQLSPESLLSTIKRMMANIKKYRADPQQVAHQFPANAAEKLVELVEAVAGK